MKTKWSRYLPRLTAGVIWYFDFKRSKGIVGELISPTQDRTIKKLAFLPYIVHDVNLIWHFSPIAKSELL